jgi:hypothetical protein
MPTITVKNIARRPEDLPSGRVLAHGERGEDEDTPELRAKIDAGLLVACEPLRPPTVEQLREQAEQLGHTVPAKTTRPELEALIASGPKTPQTSEGGDA